MNIFGKTVRSLMEERGLRAAELGQLVNLPTASIRHIITGNNNNPSANTLLILSNFFKVSIDTLLGHTLEKEQDEFGPPEQLPSPEHIPVLDFSEVKAWLHGEKSKFKKKSVWLPIDATLPIKSFGLKMQKYPFRNVFPFNSVIIINPEASYTENDYVLVSVDSKLPSIRQISIQDNQRYLNSVGVTLPSIELNDNHKILGTVIEYRYQLIYGTLGLK